MGYNSGGCGSGAGGIMKVVVAVALLLLFSASPLLFFPSSFSVCSSIFVIVDDGCVTDCIRQAMIHGKERFFFPYLYIYYECSNTTPISDYIARF
jgi:hypothetical protein